jgi:hypothetical protein
MCAGVPCSVNRRPKAGHPYQAPHQVDLEDPAGIPLIDADRAPDRREYAGVVDGDVDVAKVRPGLTGQRLHGFPIGDVAFGRDGLNAGTGQLRGGLAGRRRVDIGDHDMRARPGNHGDLASKLFHEFLPPPWTPKSGAL